MIHFALLLLACNDKAPSPDSPRTDSVRSRDTAPDSDPFVCEAPVLTETGAIFVTALAPDGSACTEWTEVGFTPPEGGDVRYVGAVNALSPDVLVLTSSGWQYGKGTGGGVVLWEVAP